MIYLGKVQELLISKAVPHGFYLSSPMPPPTKSQLSQDCSLLKEDSILLPKNSVPKDAKLDDVIKVFIYKDSEDRPIATTVMPPLVLGKVAELEVASVTDIGIFLNWGLPKELLLPYGEQTYTPIEGDTVIVALYIDKSQRLCATMKVYDYLSLKSPYFKNDRVTGKVYEIIENFGAFVAVDSTYSALIPKHVLYDASLKCGDVIEARVTSILEDGKINLDLREKRHIQIDSDSAIVLDKLKTSHDGFLPYHDKSDPEAIKATFNISKAAFKRAIGHLMKDGFIAIREDGISMRTNKDKR